MQILKKLNYGLKQIFFEMIGKEDYWHVRLEPQAENSFYYYVHKMIKKGNYPGEVVEGIPIFYLNGKHPVYFYTTIINYGLGLLERRDTNLEVERDIKKIAKWLIDSQNNDGSWRYNFAVESGHPLADNKPSGMSQGLAISFLVRVRRLGLINSETALRSIEKAVIFMESKVITSDINGHKFIQEFYVPGKSELNGAIFALYGLYDYGVEINNLEKFQSYLAGLKMQLKQYKFYHWSYYDMEGSISSKFYHQLHLDMLKVLMTITKDPMFEQYLKYWTRGLRFSLIFTFFKCVQKIININKMPMNSVHGSKSR